MRLPVHRIASPWSVVAMPLEVGHDFHADPALWKEMPRLTARRLTRIGLSGVAMRTRARCHEGIYADLIGGPPIGPYSVGSLMDVDATDPVHVAPFSKQAVHPAAP